MIVVEIESVALNHRDTEPQRIHRDR